MDSGVLPEEKENVQVTYLAYNNKPYCDGIAYMENGEWYWDDENGNKVTVEILAWKPVGKPYKEK